MATSSEPQALYYCHGCNKQIRSVEVKQEDSSCLLCGSDFIEELEAQQAPTTTSTSVPASSRTEEDSRAGRHRSRRRERGGDNLAEVLGQYIVQLLQAREQLEDTENYTLPVIPPPPHFLLGPSMMSDQQRVRSNPRNYAWGRTGMDNIVSQLLDRMGGSGGPPPADEDKIKALSHFKISGDGTSREMDCSVCKDQFKENDEVCQLPCKHIYHDGCIIPWLKLHDTCPTCRYSLNKGKVLEAETETVN